MSNIVTYPLNGIDYDARDAAGYTATRTSGVYSSEEDFTVTAAGGLSVTVGAGVGWIHPARFEGYSVIQREADTLTLALADGQRPRIDRIVLRYDAAARKSSLLVLQGTPDTQPTAPDISRTALLYDLCLAQITRPAGSTTIVAGNITDTRLDPTLCGVMRDGVTGIPTEELIAQWNDILAQQDAAGKAYLADMQKRADKIIRNYSGGYVGRYPVTLQPAGWVVAPGSTGYGYQCDAALADATTDHVPIAAVALGSQGTAAECQMALSCEAFDGFVRFSAKTVPGAPIIIDVTLLGPSTTSSGGSNYDVASDDEVKDMLDRVYNN